MKTLIIFSIIFFSGCSAYHQIKPINYWEGSSSSNINEATSYKKEYSSFTYIDLVKYNLDCNDSEAKIDFLEKVLDSKTFYIVDGIAGSDNPKKINKKFFSLAKHRIWQLRTSCGINFVSRNNFENIYKNSISQVNSEIPGEILPNVVCAFKSISNEKISNDNSATKIFSTTKSEICTNYRKNTSNFLRVGDMFNDPLSLLDPNPYFTPGVKKYKNSIYLFRSVVEVHAGIAVQLSVVLMFNQRSKNFIVVDLF
jgi:hypothetical protein